MKSYIDDMKEKCADASKTLDGPGLGNVVLGAVLFGAITLGAYCILPYTF